MGAFNLYSTPNLAAPANWAMVTNTPWFGTNNWTVTAPAGAAGQLFYRLQQ
jgi:hypothetical protein